MDSHNNTYHRGVQCKPSEVTVKIRKTSSGNSTGPKKYTLKLKKKFLSHFVFKDGDMVRITHLFKGRIPEESLTFTGVEKYS